MFLPGKIQMNPHSEISMIDYKNELNPAQYEAATTIEGPVLVIAGAGSGKTRTIVYRLANLVESGIPAFSILLLTFTRKAAQEMLERARFLLGQRGMGGLDHAGLAGVQGGTFHAFAYSVLRIFRPEGYERDATVMDSSDALAILQHCREELQAGKGDRSFPRNQTVMGLLSKCRNCERELDDILRRESGHLLPHADMVRKIGEEYTRIKRERGLLDYDDLLFEFEKVLMSRVDALNYCRRKYRYLMVDEFQDTNLVQARLTSLISGARDGAQGAEEGASNIMAVGDDAQSIYAFRGANVSNILNFPNVYPGTRLIRLEENYRSTQPVLDLGNAILEHARDGFKKHLFTRQPGSDLPQVLRPMSDLSQGGLVVAKIIELLNEYPPHEIAVLFRAGYQSYHTEVQLNKLGIRFRKYGGIRYAEAAHIKDVMAFVRLVLNPLDFTAFKRLTDFIRGIGPKTSLKLHQAMQMGDHKALEKAFKKYPALQKHLGFLTNLRSSKATPGQMVDIVIEHYQPLLEELYPDDYPRRRQGLDELSQIAAAYQDVDLFIADLSLDDPLAEEEARDSVTLSTIHSAKGLEWGAVIILDLVEERFPSKHALQRDDDYEEERRLFYVACTRAKKYLGLFVPATIYDRGSGGAIPAVPSPFVRELGPTLYGEWQESFAGGWVKREAGAPLGGGSFSRPGGSFVRPAGVPNLGSSAGGDNEPFEHPQSRRAKAGRRETTEFASGPDYTAMEADALKCAGKKSVNALQPSECGYCTHKIFGRGKVVKFMPPDKYQVNFPGIGLKVIMGAFLSMEKE